MALQEEIDSKSKEIHSDSYSMSIGEIVSLYKEGELDIHPDFQRFYRWNVVQKSKLIESLLLGIPIPSIFVAQRSDGVWDVIDGLQRLSTIFEFMGILKDDNGKLINPLKLIKTNYLPSLEGKIWEPGSEEDINRFTQAQRLIIKRAKLDIQIVKRESDDDAKFELFQRLNTGGSALSAQEVRNCLLVMLDKDRFNWLNRLANNTDFLECISITERSIKESYNNELVLRFVIYRNLEADEIARSSELNEFITNKMIDFVQNNTIDFQKEEEVFIKTFRLMNKTLGDSSFRKYDAEKDKFKGAFSISAFEAIVPGFSSNIDTLITREKNDIETKIKSIWSIPRFIEHSGAGLRASDRVIHLFAIGREIFG
jgi:uncharacterized protein with ParB-like and HNH nuclease domain